MKEKELKFDKGTRLTITEDAGTREVENIFTGEIVTQKLVNKYVAENEVSLGSVKSPNKKIIEVKYFVPMGQKDFFTGWRR